jgi:hypothetical protein
MLVLGATAMIRSPGNFFKSWSHNGGRRFDSSSAINRKSGFVSATSDGTSSPFSASPTMLIPSCSDKVESTSSRNSRGTVGHQNADARFHGHLPCSKILVGFAFSGQAANGTGRAVLRGLGLVLRKQDWLGTKLVFCRAVLRGHRANLFRGQHRPQ